MGTVRGCNIPKDLYYDIEHKTWVRQHGDGSATVGLSAYASALIGTILSCIPKRPGREIRKDKSCATIESARWVGPARSPVGGIVLEINEHLAATPASINADPYGEGWLVRIQPKDWEFEIGNLVTGAEALAAFEAKMAADGFNRG